VVLKRGWRSAVGLLTRDLRFSVPRPAPTAWPGILVGLGVVLRLVVYFADRPFWMDEASIESNITDRPIFAFRGPLSSDQLAPYGFLVVERTISHLLGSSRLALRLYPLACGLAAVFLFREVARRCLNARAGLWALALFALSDDLIYYSSELKPYASDVAIALIGWWLGSEWITRPGAPPRLVLAAGVGTVAPWFSFPAVFVLAAVGLVLAISALARRDGRRLAGLAGLGMLWLASFGLSYVASLKELGPRTTMWVFWAFAFPPCPPRSWADLGRIGRMILGLFINPFQFATPLGPRLSAALGLGLAGLGGLVFARTRRTWLILLILPLGLAWLSACGRFYPFHGRVLLFATPALIVLVAEGIEQIRSRLRRPWLAKLWLGFMLLSLVLGALFTLAQAGRDRPYDPHGDLHRDVFDLP
jgi:hypothetical protein